MESENVELRNRMVAVRDWEGGEIERCWSKGTVAVMQDEYSSGEFKV